jgi:hypothetical protein
MAMTPCQHLKGLTLQCPACLRHPRGAWLLATLSITWLQAAWAVPAAPGQAYRCKGPDGHTIYSQQPCGDQAELRRVDDARTPAQALDGRLMSERESKLGRQLERQRRHEERAAALREAMPLTRPARHHVGATDMPTAAASTPATASTQRLKRMRHFTALVPKAPKASQASTP